MNVYINLPVVSVIIPTFGHAEFILQTLDSVFGQTFKDFEIIVVNDGSPDNTEDVLKPLIESQKIRYINQKNAGVATARNTGILHSAGKYIALLDDDDLWPSDKLEWQVDYLERTSAVMVGGAVEIFGSGETVVFKSQLNEIKELSVEIFFDGNPFHSPGQVMIRRNSLIEVGGFDEKIWGSDDMDMWMSLSRIGKLFKINRVSLRYRVHESNASRNQHRMILNSKLVIEKHLGKLPPDRVAGCSRRGYLWLFNYLGYGLLFEAIGRENSNQIKFMDRVDKLKTLLRVFSWRLLIYQNLFKRVWVCMKAIGGEWRRDTSCRRTSNNAKIAL